MNAPRLPDRVGLPAYEDSALAVGAWQPLAGKRQTARTSLVDLDEQNIPLYKLIKVELTRFLRGDTIKTGMALPTEKELAQRYRVSVGTVRRAVLELVAEKIVVRQQGRGTFLAPFDTSRMLNSFWHIRRKDGEREPPWVRTLRFGQTIAEGDIAARLGVAPGSRLFSIDNLMLMGGRPVLLDNLQIPVALFPGMTELQFVSREATIYDLYRSGFGINIVKTTDHVRAVAADREAARILGRRSGAPLLEIVRVAYTFEDKPVEFRRSLLDTENYEFMDVTGGETNL